ncbi:MAG: 3'-5' exonuclease [Candidatus Margulisiibacteriota bacterium]
MLVELLKDQQFQQLEKEYKFLSRARGATLDDIEFVIVDIETTGLEPSLCEITEIGAMKVMGKEFKDVYSSLIKTKYPIPAEITRLTGIDDEMVKDSPDANSVLKKFVAFLGDAVLIAHNVDFDIPFIKHHLKKNLSLEINNPALCTVKLSRKLLPQLPNHKLHTVAAHYGINVQNRHRAMGDVELTFQVWEHFIQRLKEQGISNKAQLDAFIAQL